MTTTRAVLPGVLLVALAASPAFAQIDNRLALGATFSTRHAPDDSSVADGGHDVQFEWRIGHTRKSSWGWQYGLNWFTTGVHRQIGGGSLELGQLRVRPLMGGYGYTWLINPRTAVTVNLLAGYAISSFRMEPAAGDAYRSRLGARAVTSDATNTLVGSPEVHLWYDLNKKFGLMISGSYLVARPEVTIRSSLGDDVHRVHADTYTLRTGLVYRIF